MVFGLDVLDFLQGLIMIDFDMLQLGVVVFGVLLMLQGKIMFFFMIFKVENGFFIEMDVDIVDVLIKCFIMYKLCVKVEIIK